MKHLILGTAGHIDHGKTSLVKALTGTDTDRLPEEKARGITIELGFACLNLGGGTEFDIVDVPGHERFVRAMVAGVGGMDLVMLVIAADAGVMPQTREHLEICQLLGVRKGLVVLTKIDLVDPEFLELIKEEVIEYLEGSFLDGAPLVPVSVRSGAGLEQLKEQLKSMAADLEQKRGDGPFRLPVDRVFTVAGFGTVVTGTLLSGNVAVGADVEILPSRLQCRVRGIQVHSVKADRCDAGQRLALNLQGIEHSIVSRGDIVVPAGLYRCTTMVDVKLRLLASYPRDLKNRTTLRLHSATYEVPAQVVLLDRSSLKPGDITFAQLRLSRPVLLLTGDPFVLRSDSPQATVGGGTVLDPYPPRRRRRTAQAIELLASIESGSDQVMLEGLVANALLSGISLDELVNRTGLSRKRIEAALTPLLSSGRLVQVLRDPRIFLSEPSFSALQSDILAELHRFLDHNPLMEGIGRQELKSRMPRRSDQRFFAACISSLEKAGKVVSLHELVKPGGSARPVAGQDELQLRLEQALVTGGIEPPTLKELCAIVNEAEKELLGHLHMMLRAGRVVKVKSDLFYTPASLALLQEKLLSHLTVNREITPAEFRDLTGLSRKYMIPVLEYFDAQKITIRAGDKRLLRG